MLFASERDLFDVDLRKTHQRAQISNIPVFPGVNIITAGVFKGINPVKPSLKNIDIEDRTIPLRDATATASIQNECP